MKILIADDEPLARERLLHLFREINQDHLLIEAGNGLEAIEQVNQEEPDIVLMDIRMPGMNGLEATSHLMTIDKPPAIIFTTAYNNEEFQKKAGQLGIVKMITKPIKIKDLMTQIASIVNAAKA